MNFSCAEITLSVKFLQLFFFLFFFPFLFCSTFFLYFREWTSTCWMCQPRRQITFGLGRGNLTCHSCFSRFFFTFIFISYFFGWEIWINVCEKLGSIYGFTYDFHSSVNFTLSTPVEVWFLFCFLSPFRGFLLLDSHRKQLRDSNIFTEFLSALTRQTTPAKKLFYQRKTLDFLFRSGLLNNLGSVRVHSFFFSSLFHLLEKKYENKYKTARAPAITATEKRFRTLFHRVSPID